jgi:hypothetical protein
MSNSRLGIGHRTSDTSAGAHLIINAAPDRALLDSYAMKTDCMYPVTQKNHPRWRWANRGALAFTIRGEISQRLYGYSEEMDSKRYLPYLNGAFSSNTTVDQARRMITFEGIIMDDVQGDFNLGDKGNTLMIGKGKYTILNSGNERIPANSDVSWDVPIPEIPGSDTTNSYGFRMSGDREPTRVELCVVPSPAPDDIAHRVYQEVIGYGQRGRVVTQQSSPERTTAHKNFLDEMWRSVLKIGFVYNLATQSLLKERIYTINRVADATANMTTVVLPNRYHVQDTLDARDDASTFGLDKLMVSMDEDDFGPNDSTNKFNTLRNLVNDSKLTYNNGRGAGRSVNISPIGARFITENPPTTYRALKDETIKNIADIMEGPAITGNVTNTGNTEVNDVIRIINDYASQPLYDLIYAVGREYQMASLRRIGRNGQLDSDPGFDLDITLGAAFTQ